MYNKKILPIIFLLSIFLNLSVSSLVWAQSGGANAAGVTGTVNDEQGNVIPNATVVAKNTKTNLTREVRTDEGGSYIFQQLPPGSYELTTTADGFSSRTSRIELSLGNTARLNFSLQVGGTSEIIEVTTTNLIEEAKTESSTNIDRQRIDTLPINRRNFLDFSLTAPRVLADRVPAQGAAATSGLSFNGQNARVNNITIDGLDNNDYGTGSVRSTFSQEAVQEFQVVSNSYSAEFGRALGGVVNIVTRGGSNEFHGNLFFINRNDKISARDVFSPFRPNYDQYQFGNTISGPIKKDKAFFFASFERLSIKQNSFVTISDQTIRSANSLGFTTLRNGPIPFSVGTTSVLGRVDANITPSNTFWARYNFGGTYNGAFEPFGGIVGETNGGIQTLDDNTVAASNTYVNSGLNLVNETRFYFSKRDQNVVQLENGPQVRLVAPEGFLTFGRGTFLPQPRELTLYQITNNTSLTRGRHQLKFGVDFNYYNTPNLKTSVPIFAGGFSLFLPIDFSSALGMPNLPTLTGLQAFDPKLRTPEQRAFLTVLSTILPGTVAGFPNLPLADLPLPSGYFQGFGDPRIVIKATVFSTFFQDDIKIKPNLVVKAGVRYDINRVDFFPDNNGNFSPRLAISYRPRNSSKLSINAAYGLFFAGPVTGPSFVVGLNNGSPTAPLKVTAVPFPFSVIPFAQPGRSFPESTQLPPQVTFIPQLSQVFVFAPDVKNSYTQQVSAGFDYMIANNTTVSVNYQFVRGVKLLSQRSINPVVRPTANPVDSSLFGRVDPTRGDVIEFQSGFDSYFHGVTISANRRLSNKVGFLASYTVSKAIDNFIDLRPDLSEINDPLNIKNERGLSLQDVRQRFVLSGTFDLNYSNNPFLRDFQLSTILNLNTGRPYNLLAGADLNRTGDFPPGDRPLGLGRNAGIAPGFANLDLRLTRNITIKERYKIQAFAEVFNLTNRVNISEIDRTFTPDAQGNFNLPSKDGSRFVAPRERFRNAFSPRQFQLGFRVSF